MFDAIFNIYYLIEAELKNENKSKNLEKFTKRVKC